MSIAVSAVVRPSRTLRVLAGAYGLANLAAAFAVAVLLPAHFALAPLVVATLACAGVFLLATGIVQTKTRRIDISGVGTLRLTVQQDIRTNDAAGLADGTAATLLPGSTVWPQLMLLHLRLEHGGRILLPVLRDSVAPGVFRALGVAVTAIGGRNKPLQGQYKTL